MYLLERFQTASGEIYEWTGAISGETFMTEKLNRFGYITLTAESDNVFCKIGEKINGHEFHYSDSNNNGHDFLALKAQEFLNGVVVMLIKFCMLAIHTFTYGEI